MKLQRVWLTAAVICVLFAMAQRADAVILASDDFSGPASGTGWAAGSQWEGLGGGRVTTTGATNVSFRNFAAPINGTNQVTYLRFDFTQSVPGTGAQWGGAALFEGLEAAMGGTETFFAGDPGNITNYGFDLQGGTGTVNSGIAINNQPRTIIAAIDTTPAGAAATYRIWVNNFNIATPNATLTIPNSIIDAPWQSFRLANDATNTNFYDNLTIATTFGEVGLVPEPASLGLFALFGWAMLGMYRRRR
jgi:hypothetical protein